MNKSFRVQQKASEIAADLSKWAHSNGFLARGIKMRVTVRFGGTEMTPDDWHRIGYFDYADTCDTADCIVLRALFQNDNSPVSVQELSQLLPGGFTTVDMAWLNDFALKYRAGLGPVYRIRAVRNLRRNDISTWESNAVFLVRYGVNSPEIAEEDTYDPYWFYSGRHDKAVQLS